MRSNTQSVRLPGNPADVFAFLADPENLPRWAGTSWATCSDLDSQDAVAVLGVSAATYRKRLSRARERLRAFMRTHCGLISGDAACRCRRRIAHAVATGRVRPESLLFAGRGAGRPPRTDIVQPVREMEDLHRMAAIYTGHPEYAAPDRILEDIRRILDAGRLTLLR